MTTFLDGRITLHAGSCLDVLPTLAEGSVDSAVMDPPYHLTSIVKRFGGANAAPAKVGKTGAFARASRGFMGKEWDGGDIAFQPETWAAVLRVLKPGAYLVAFSGTRTYHRMVCAIEDAGFEVRDQLAWVFGSGFPKSHNISKGIDKARRDNLDWKRVGSWLRTQREARGLKQKQVAALWPSVTGGLTGCVANWELGLSCPKWDQWLQLKAFIGFANEMDAEVWRLNGRKGTPGEAWETAEVIGTKEGAVSGWRLGENGFTADFGDRPIKSANSDAARHWEGWGTALKPAWEPICLARKPLEGTNAENVLKHGVGGLNIDGCRVQGEPRVRDNTGGKAEMYDGWGMKPNVKNNASGGRWPANLIHDGSDEVLEAFPDTALSSGGRIGNKDGGEIYGGGKGLAGSYAAGDPGFGDCGSAARFFYTAKADADDRLGSKHPTVKPLDLMQYLVRLVTPKGGLVLDCFAGTGTTGEAAFREGMRAILIEREPEYQADIARRMELAENPTKRAAVAKTKNNLQGAEGTPLFGDAA